MMDTSIEKDKENDENPVSMHLHNDIHTDLSTLTIYYNLGNTSPLHKVTESTKFVNDQVALLSAHFSSLLYQYHVLGQ